MKNTEDFRYLLDIGLTEREARVYTTLLTRRMFTASELQEAVNIPRTKIYEVLQKMVNRGICIERKTGRNKIFQAVEPKVALEKIYESYKEDLQKKKELIDNAVKVYTPIFKENKEIVNPLDFIYVMYDKNEIHKQYTTTLQNTKYELLTFNKGPYACDNYHSLSEQVDEETKLLKRGGICRNIYQLSEILEYDWLFDYIKSQVKFGQKAKVIEELPIKMIIFDNEKVMLPLEGASGRMQSLTMIYIEHSQLAIASRILFEHLWNQARDFEEIEKQIMQQEVR
jgi:sugar-specific transcriptional regulator TrmB